MTAIVQRRHTIVSKGAPMISSHESAISSTTWNQQLLPRIISVFCFIGFIVNETSSMQNQVVEMNTEVRLKCSRADEKATEPIWWFANYLTQNEDKKVNLGSAVSDSLKDRFSVDNSENVNYDLVFNASKETSGIFTCVNDTRRKSFFSAYVIALDAEPKCSKERATAGFLRAICSIRFGGSWKPTLEWYNDTGKVDTKYRETSSNGITISLYLKSSTPELYNFTCVTKLDKKPTDAIGIRMKMADNTPDFSANCSIEIELTGVSPAPTKDPSEESAKESGNEEGNEPGYDPALGPNSTRSSANPSVFPSAYVIGMVSIFANVLSV